MWGGEDMDFNSVLQAITTVGFPIVCCLILFWYVAKREAATDAQIQAINEKHEQEIAKLVEAVNNNTLVMQRLLDRLVKYDGEQ